MIGAIINLLIFVLILAAVNILAFGIIKHGWTPMPYHYRPKTSHEHAAIVTLTRSLAALVFVMDAAFVITMLLGVAGLID